MNNLINKKELRISRKELRIILKYLKSHNEFNERYRNGFKGYNGVTKIRHGYMEHKEISVEKIEYIAKRIGAKSW